MSYDRADWHYGGEFPEGLPNESGGTHIGMFLAWAITRDLAGELHSENSIESLVAVRERRMTGRDFLFRECDEKFTDEDLNEEGNAFTAWYYGSDGPFLEDYERVLGSGVESLYHVADTWENFDVLAPVIDARFAEWRRTRSESQDEFVSRRDGVVQRTPENATDSGAARKPWWKLW